MKKITSKEVFTCVLMLGIIAVVAVYFLVYKKNNELAAAKEATNVTLEARVKSLKQYYDNEPKYLEEMEPIKKDIDMYLEPYPADTTDLDLIMQAVKTQQIAPIQYSNIGLGAKRVMKAVSADVVQKAAVEKYQEQISFVEHSCSLPNKISYEGLKTAVKSLFESDYLIGIKTITYVKADGDGNLQGNIELAYYSAKGTGKEYVKPELVEYISGTENIFGVDKED